MKLAQHYQSQTGLALLLNPLTKIMTYEKMTLTHKPIKFSY